MFLDECKIMENTRTHTHIHIFIFKIRTKTIWNKPTENYFSDVISFDCELYGGQMGPRGNKVASSLVKDSDLILAIGTRLGFNSTFYSYDNISKLAKIIQVDIDPIAIGRYFPVEVGIQNDVKIFLDQLIPLLNNASLKKANQNWVENFLKEKTYSKSSPDVFQDRRFCLSRSKLF